VVTFEGEKIRVPRRRANCELLGGRGICNLRGEVKEESKSGNTLGNRGAFSKKEMHLTGRGFPGRGRNEQEWTYLWF